MKTKEKSKKFDLLIAIGIVLGLYALLSYIIPTGYFSSSTYTAGETEALGLAGLLKAPVYSIAIFIQYIVVFLAIGGLYAIMSKTGVYSKIVDGVAKKFNKKQLLFLIISIVSFALLSSVFGLSQVLFLLVPFVASVLLILGFSKVTTLAATIGAILIGAVGSIYGNSLAIVNFLSLDANNSLICRIILFVIVTFLYVMFIVFKYKKQSNAVASETKTTKKTTKSTKKEEIKDELVIPFYDSKSKSKRSCVPLIVLFCVLLVISLIGMFNWYYIFKVDLFNNLATWVAGVKVFGIDILAKIFGSLTALGQWGNYEFAVVIMLATIIIGTVYCIKPKEFLETYFEGVKSMLLTAVYVALACVVFGIMVNSSNGTISATIANYITGFSSSFNVLLVTLNGFISGFFFNDFIYALNSIMGTVGNYSETVLPIAGMLLQSAFAFAMLVLPVSAILAAGLKFLDVSYTEWIKYIWKLLLQIFIVIILFGLILTMIF